MDHLHLMPSWTSLEEITKYEVVYTNKTSYQSQEEVTHLSKVEGDNNTSVGTFKQKVSHFKMH